MSDGGESHLTTVKTLAFNIELASRATNGIGE